MKIWQKKHCLKLVEPFFGHYLTKKSHNCPKLWDKSDTAPSSFSFLFLSFPLFFPSVFSFAGQYFKAAFWWEKFHDSRLDWILKTWSSKLNSLLRIAIEDTYMWTWYSSDINLTSFVDSSPVKVFGWHSNVQPLSSAILI